MVLSTLRGGLSLHITYTHASAAYLASAHQSHPLASQIHPEHTMDHVAHACDQYNKLIGEKDTLEALKLKWGILAPKQKGFSAALEDKALKDIIEIAEPLMAARLRALKQPGTSKWLTSTPDPQWDTG